MHPVTSTIVPDGGESNPGLAGGDTTFGDTVGGNGADPDADRVGGSGPVSSNPTGPGPVGRAGYAASLLLMVGLGALVAHLLAGLGDRLDSIEQTFDLASAPTEPVSLVEAPAVERAYASTDRKPATNRSLPALSEEAELGRRALDQIAFAWEESLPGWRISFHGERPGLYGLTLVDEKRIEVYVRDGQDLELLVHILAHEIGHAIDVTMNDGTDRRRWQEARGIGTEPWWPGEAASDFATGAGDFAEGFAFWQAGPEHFRSKIAPPPTEEQIALLVELAADR